MSRLNNNDDRASGAHVFESRPSPVCVSLDTAIDWQQFYQFLLQRMTPNTAEDRLRYAKHYASVLHTGIPVGLLQLSPHKRIHAMKALSSLARFTGKQDAWLAIRQRYGLQWSTGTEKLDAFTRFFDSSKDLDTMIGWLSEAIRSTLPKPYANFLLFCTLTGLRASECVEAVRLINSTSQSTGTSVNRASNYYNPEQNILQHYRFPELFIRRTKAVYISVMNDEILGIAQSIGKSPTLIGLKKAIKHRSLSMRLKYCRKIYASWLHKYGISDSLIDMLQGRIGKNIFLKHYLTPTRDFKDHILQALEQLQRELD
jgi:hypothetical protein